MELKQPKHTVPHVRAKLCWHTEEIAALYKKYNELDARIKRIEDGLKIVGGKT